MSNKVPKDRLYSREHEWIKLEGDTALVGITDHAQAQLGDVVFLELPESGTQIKIAKALGVVESVKAVSDIFSPLTGEILEINSELVNLPEVVNQSPYDQAWMLKMKVQDKKELSQLMDAEAYEIFLLSETK